MSDYLVAAIRRIWYWSPNRKAVKKAAKACALCGKVCDKYDIDHIVPVGPKPAEWKNWDQYLNSMFEGKLQALCKECHKEKTAEDIRVMRQTKKGIK